MLSLELAFAPLLALARALALAAARLACFSMAAISRACLNVVKGKR